MTDQGSRAGFASVDTLDLRDPVDLERAEEATGAVARAVAHDRGLRFRGHLLYLGSRIAPARAPHVRPSVDTQQVTDLRGAADAIALRVRYSSPAVYQRFRPSGSLEDLIYEMLEQFRVEALAPEAARGIKANLALRFAAWSDACIAEGLLENDVGLLLFTAAHVCRSRILAEPIGERVNDHTESTRFGIYEVMGQHLLALRPAISDQVSFAPHAAAIARDIGALAEASSADGGRSAAPSTVLAMLTLPELDASEGDHGHADGSNASSRLGEHDGYAVFTDAYDRTFDVREMVRDRELQAARTELDLLQAQHQSLGGYLRRSALRIFAEPEDTAWDSEQEEGYLDPRLLVGLVTGRGDGRLYRRPVPDARPAGAVSILIDCSGSMKAVIRELAALIDLVVRALDGADVATEVLGYTTGAWSGGRPYREWLSASRPAHPGRLNEAHHIVFKDAATSWRRSRAPLAGLLWTPMFREGLDGEALEWAYGRLRSLDAPRRHLLLVSDGSPMDGATTLANGESYLDRHLVEVAEAIEADGQIRLAGLGIGHDMSAYMSRSRIVDPDRILDRPTAQAVMGFLAAP